MIKIPVIKFTVGIMSISKKNLDTTVAQTCEVLNLASGSRGDQDTSYENLLWEL